MSGSASARGRAVESKAYACPAFSTPRRSSSSKPCPCRVWRVLISPAALVASAIQGVLPSTVLNCLRNEPGKSAEIAKLSAPITVGWQGKLPNMADGCACEIDQHQRTRAIVCLRSRRLDLRAQPIHVRRVVHPDRQETLLRANDHLGSAFEPLRQRPV